MHLQQWHKCALGVVAYKRLTADSINSCILHHTKESVYTIQDQARILQYLHKERNVGIVPTTKTLLQVHVAVSIVLHYQVEQEHLRQQLLYLLLGVFTST